MTSFRLGSTCGPSTQTISYGVPPCRVQCVNTRARQIPIIPGVDRHYRAGRNPADPPLGRKVVASGHDIEEHCNHTTQRADSDTVPQPVVNDLGGVTGTVNDPDSANPFVHHAGWTDQERTEADTDQFEPVPRQCTAAGADIRSRYRAPHVESALAGEPRPRHCPKRVAAP